MTVATARISKNQLDKLGDRLKAHDGPSSEDVEMLSSYQSQMEPLLLETMDIVRNCESYSELEFTSRQKQLPSIVAKLRRSSTKLSQMQDIVGFRAVVDDFYGLHEMEDIADELEQLGHWRLIDRTKVPSNGYRAYHLIHATSLNPIEFQLRTELQHQWAELSELFERTSPGTKYGRGPEGIQQLLMKLSRAIQMKEDAQFAYYEGDESVIPENYPEVAWVYFEDLEWQINEIIQQMRESASGSVA